MNTPSKGPMAEEENTFSDLVKDQRVLVIRPSTDFITAGHVLHRFETEASYRIPFIDSNGKTDERIFDFSGGEKHLKGRTGYRLLRCPPEVDQTPYEFFRRRIDRCLLHDNLIYTDEELKAVCDAIPARYV